MAEPIRAWAVSNETNGQLIFGPGNWDEDGAAVHALTVSHQGHGAKVRVVELVEAVRCRDCVHGKDVDNSDVSKLWCVGGWLSKFPVGEYDYCSRYRAKEEGNGPRENRY